MAVSPSPAPIAVSASWNWRAAPRGQLPEDVPACSMSATPSRGAVRLLRRLPCRRNRDRSGDRDGADRALYRASTTSACIINPMLVAGQAHGGIAQGIGQALMECVSYDESGQPITGSFMDYAMPRAGDIPVMAVGDHRVPAKSNPLGTKGCGEAGCAGSLSTIVNAVVNALSEFGIAAYRHAADPGAGIARHPGRGGKVAWRQKAVPTLPAANTGQRQRASILLDRRPPLSGPALEATKRLRNVLVPMYPAGSCPQAAPNRPPEAPRATITVLSRSNALS